MIRKADKLLILPDAHAHPNYDNERFSLLGRFIRSHKPDAIVCLGDFADMPSLCSYDRGTRGFEGRRYKRDVAVTKDALSRLRSPAFDAARKVMLLGNHEQRIGKATNSHSELDGTIAIADLGYEKAGFRVVPYEVPEDICGFQMCHHFATGVSGRPISGTSVAASLIRLLMTSAVVGHNHVFDHAERTRPDGTKVVGLSAGCFCHPRMIEGWNKSTAHMYWNGVILLTGARNGYYRSMHCLTQEWMTGEYGR